MIPVGAGQLLAAVARRGIGGKSIAGAGKNYHAVFRVAGNLAEQKGKFIMGFRAPDQVLAVSVQRQLQDAVAPLQFNVFVLVGVILELDCHLA